MEAKRLHTSRSLSRGFILGGPYALLAIGVVVLGLSITCYALKKAVDAARARAEVAEQRAEQLTEALQTSEASVDALRAAAEVLDQTVRERDRRYAQLQVQKRDLDAKYRELREKVAAEDQACLDRDLPDSFAERLRN